MDFPERIGDGHEYSSDGSALSLPDCISLLTSTDSPFPSLRHSRSFLCFPPVLSSSPDRSRSCRRGSQNGHIDWRRETGWLKDKDWGRASGRSVEYLKKGVALEKDAQ